MNVFRTRERCSARYTAQLKDETGAAVPAASITTMVLSFFDVATAAAINGRTNQNVLNANGVTVDASGNVVWTMTPDDHQILGSAPSERHRARFDVTWAAGAKRLVHEVDFEVENIGGVA